jgi:pyruvate formate lyase activating enzyme
MNAIQFVTAIVGEVIKPVEGFTGESLQRHVLQGIGNHHANSIAFAAQPPGRIIGHISQCSRGFFFYQNSGGGITLSGGEPMGQFGFALAILQACRERGIHTCIETNGFAPQRKYSEILPFTDIFLFDYKTTGSAAHQNLTWVRNDRILSNLEYLYRQGPAIVLRCPLIPGVNDTPEHFDGIAKIARKYPDLQGIELMAYHDYGKDKGLRLGQEYLLKGVQTADDATQQGWLKALAALGCEKAVIG